MRRIVIWSRSRRQSVRMPHTRWCRLRLWISHKRMQRCHLCLGAKYKHSESWRSVRNTRRLQFSCTIWFCTFVFFVRTRDIAAESSFILQWSPVGAVTRLVEHPMPCSNVKPSHDFNAWCRLLQLTRFSWSDSLRHTLMTYTYVHWLTDKNDVILVQRQKKHQVFGCEPIVLKKRLNLQRKQTIKPTIFGVFP